ncbi:MAG: hypothetical protein WKF43_11705 [Acidimicrobiales bacterium]
MSERVGRGGSTGSSRGGGESVAGERFTSTDEVSDRASPGRVCADSGCETKLSIYNDGEHCSLHQPMETPRMRGRKIA